ncbi:unnamed protein product [Pylaiella littoralis]
MKGGCQQSNRHEARLIYCQGPGAAGTLPQQQKKKHAKWCRENASLRKLSSNLQRDAHQIFGTRGDLQHDAVALLAQERGDANARRTEVAGVRRRLETQKAVMSNIKKEIQRLSNGEDVSEGLEEQMEGLEDELYEFKYAMRKGYDELVVKEKGLSFEVEELRGKVKEWEQRPRGDAPAQAAVAAAAAATTTTTRVCAENDRTLGPSGIDDGIEGGAFAGEEIGDGEARKRVSTSCGRGGVDQGHTQEAEKHGDAVERINNLIRQEGGVTGGWPQHEHDCFLRLWTQASSRGPKSGARPPPSSPADRAAVSSLLQRAQTMLPARSAEEVGEHLAWFQRYKDYHEEKRRLARAWREQRQHDQRADAETAEPLNDTCGVPPGGRVASEESRRAAAAERDRKKREVEEWRAAKEAKERELKEQQAVRRASESARVDEERRRQRRVHEQVAAYRLDREREDDRRREVERMLAREQRRTMYSQADLEDRAKRDVDQARQRCQENASREFQRKEADNNRKNAASGRWAGVAADRSRLLKGTKASKEKALDPEDLDDQEAARANLPAHCSRIAISGRDLRFNAGRAMPSWCRGCV